MWGGRNGIAPMYYTLKVSTATCETHCFDCDPVEEGQGGRLTRLSETMHIVR